MTAKLAIALTLLVTQSCRKVEPESPAEGYGTVAYTPVSATVTTPNLTSSMGVALASFGSSSSEWITIDQMMQGTPWQVVACDATFESGITTGLTMDEQGWVTQIPSGKCAATHLFKGAKANYPTGTYLISFSGTGTFTISGDSSSVRLLSPTVASFDVPHNSTTGVLLKIDALSAQNPIKNIKVIAPGGACGKSPDAIDPFSYCASSRGGVGTCQSGYTCYDFKDTLIDTTAVTVTKDFVSKISSGAKTFFHPVYLQSLQSYRTLAFGPWLSSATATDVTVPALNANQAQFALFRGAPWAFAISLSNLIKAEPWITIPVFMPDASISAMAAAFAASLNSDLPLYLEYANEYWISGSPSRVYLDQKATELSLPTFEHAYLNRAFEIMKSWQVAFSTTSSRIRLVETLDAEDAAAPARLQSLLTEPTKFSHIATSMNFAIPAVSLAGPTGIASLFQSISGGGNVTDVDASLGKTATFAQAMVAAAKSVGLPLVARAAGPTYQPPQASNDLRDAARSDARLGAAILKNLAQWKDSGGTLILANKSADDGSTFLPWGVIRQQQGDTYESAKAVAAFIAANPCWWEGCQTASLTDF